MVLIWKDEDSYDKQIDTSLKLLGVAEPRKQTRALVKSIIAKESSFNPNAYRSEPQIKDASRGLMQILYKTAQGVGFTGREADLLYKPEVNIYFGAKFLLDLMRRHPQLNDAIASYNAGRPKKKEDGTYINQDYVDKVRLYLEYFLAKEFGEEDKAKEVKSRIVKKKSP